MPLREELEDAEGGSCKKRKELEIYHNKYHNSDDVSDEEDSSITLRHRKKKTEIRKEKSGITNDGIIHYSDDSDEEEAIWDACIDKVKEMYRWLTRKNITYLRSSLTLITKIERILAYAMTLSILFFIWQMWPIIENEEQPGKWARSIVYIFCTFMILFFTMGQKWKSIKVQFIGGLDQFLLVFLFVLPLFIVWNYKYIKNDAYEISLRKLKQIDIIPLEDQNDWSCAFERKDGKYWEREDLDQIFEKCHDFIKTIDFKPIERGRNINFGEGWTKDVIETVHRNIMDKRKLKCVCPVMYGKRFPVISLKKMRDKERNPILLFNPKIKIPKSSRFSKVFEKDPCFKGGGESIIRRDQIELNYVNQYGEPFVEMLSKLNSHCVQSCLEKMYPSNERYL